MLLGVKKGDVYDKEEHGEPLGIGHRRKQGRDERRHHGIVHIPERRSPHILVGAGRDSGGRRLDRHRATHGGGKRFTVNDVIIAGNNRTNDRVVRRELYVRPARLCDQSMLINTLNVIRLAQPLQPRSHGRIL